MQGPRKRKTSAASEIESVLDWGKHRAASSEVGVCWLDGLEWVEPKETLTAASSEHGAQHAPTVWQSVSLRSMWLSVSVGNDQ